MHGVAATTVIFKRQYLDDDNLLKYEFVLFGLVSRRSDIHHLTGEQRIIKCASYDMCVFRHIFIYIYIYIYIYNLLSVLYIYGYTMKTGCCTVYIHWASSGFLPCSSMNVTGPCRHHCIICQLIRAQ